MKLGWANRQRLAHDAAFESLRDEERVRRLLVDATARVTLVPPVGSGGLP